MRHFVLSLLVFSSFIVFSQGSVKEGINAFNNGDIEQAEKILSEVMKSPVSVNDKDRANGWYYLGRAKSYLMTEAMSMQSPDVLGKYKGFDLDAYHCFKEALKAPGGKKLRSSIAKEMESLGYVLFNSGNSYYVLGESMPSLEYYDKAAEIAKEYGMKDDYQIYNLRGQTYMAVGDSSSAYSDYSKAIMRYMAGPPEIPDANIGYAFYSQAVIDRYDQNDIDQALQRLRLGKELVDKEATRLENLIKNPEGLSLPILGAQEAKFQNIKDALTRFELDIYRASPEKYDEAIEKFEAALKNNPNDANLWLVYGNLVEIKDLSTAYDAYKKAIEINPDNDIAHFNAGANRVNKGVEYARKANDEFDFAKAQEWQDKVNEEFKLALPHLEKAHELDPENVYVVEALIQVTIQLEMMDEYEIYKDKKQKLTGY